MLVIVFRVRAAHESFSSTASRWVDFASFDMRAIFPFCSYNKIIIYHKSRTWDKSRSGLSAGMERQIISRTYVRVCRFLSLSPSFSPRLLSALCSAYYTTSKENNKWFTRRGRIAQKRMRPRRRIFISYFFLLFCRVNGGLAVRGRSLLKRVKFKLILYLRRRVGHSTSFADPFVFVTARPPTPLSAYKSFRQLGNKRRVLMDLRASAATSIFPLLSFNSFCSKTRHERR